MARHRKKKCPNCGQRTIVDDKWSCQWCHWPLLVKHPLEIKQREFALWRLTWKWVGIYILVAIVLCVLTALYYSDWKLPDFEQLILGQWHEWLLFIFLAFVTLIFLHFVIHYLAARIRPEFLVAALFIIGIFLLVASDKKSLYYEHIIGWIDARWNIDLFTASLTVFSLAFAFASIIVIREQRNRTEREK